MEREVFIRMSQLEWQDQGEGLGRGQRPEGEAEAEADQGEWRLLGSDHHRGQNSVWWDGCLVSSGEEIRQVLSIRIHPVTDQCRDQRRRTGEQKILKEEMNYNVVGGICNENTSRNRLRLKLEKSSTLVVEQVEVWHRKLILMHW